MYQLWKETTLNPDWLEEKGQSLVDAHAEQTFYDPNEILCIETDEVISILLEAKYGFLPADFSSSMGIGAELTKLLIEFFKITLTVHYQNIANLVQKTEEEYSLKDDLDKIISLI